MRTVWSMLPEASSLLSGLKAIERTSSLWPWRLRKFWPLETSHNLTV